LRLSNRLAGCRVDLVSPTELAVLVERRDTFRDIVRRLLTVAPELTVWVFWWNEWDYELAALEECALDAFPDGAQCFDEYATPFAVTVTV